jgi:hypothetical protein
MIMKREILVGVVILFATVSVAQTQESELKGAIDVTFTSKYVWRGFDVYDDHAAIHPSIDLDLFGTGFGFNATAHRANSSGFELYERWDYTLYYQNCLFADESYFTKYRLGYVYYNYPDLSSHTTGSIDLQEMHAILSWPKILNVEGLVPTYCLVKLWPSNSGTIVGDASPFGGTASGWAHIFMLDYGIPFTCPITGEARTLNLHSEIVYNDGVGPTGGNVDHDWSNAVLGASTVFNLSDNLSFTPGIYYQASWDDSVNTEDEFWVSLSMTYKF